MDQIFSLLKNEEERQKNTISLIASENKMYKEVGLLLGSCLSEKYSEGYPDARYYAGNAIIDQIENEAIAATRDLFGVVHANVQPYSGSPANMAVQMATLSAGDTIMGLSLSGGGHLTHGHPVSFSGKFFNSVQFGVDKDGYIDLVDYEKKVKAHKPKLVILGTTSYPRIIDFEKMAKIAHDEGSYVLADISHIVGLVAAGLHPSPVLHADVITTTTHKMLKGPRGAVIMVTELGVKKDPELPRKIDRAVFPGLQGGPHNATVAAIAYTMRQAATNEYKEYAKRVLTNSKALANSLKSLGFTLTTGGTDNHLMVLDLTHLGITGKEASGMLESVGIVVNANAIPFDPRGPRDPSGIRLGTPSVTSRGMGEPQMELIANAIKLSLSSNQSGASEIVKALASDFV